MKKLLLTLMALFVFVGTKAINRDSNGTYLISSLSDWITFASIVNNGSNPAANAKMTKDIDLGSNQTMIGTATHPYQGVFNGQRYTLTVNLNGTTAYTAPFAYCGDGATISRLVIAGNITSTKDNIAGVVGNGSGTVNLNVVQVTATIHGDQFIGGLAGYMQGGSTLNATDCFFTGVQSSNRCTAAMIATNESGVKVQLTNTLLMGTYTGENRHCVSHDGTTFTATNSYLCMDYTDSAPGSGLSIVDRDRIATGEIAMLLQGNRSEQIWGQDLVNFSSTPVLTANSSMRVYSNGDGMYGNDPNLPRNNAYAIWCAGNTTLYFDYAPIGLRAGDKYNGQTVTRVWSGANVVSSPSGDFPVWNSTVREMVTDVVIQPAFKKMRPISLYAWFYNFQKITGITNLENLNSSRTTTMALMFQGCSSLKEIDINPLDISSLVNTRQMFCSCSNLRAVYCDKSYYPQVSTANSKYMFLSTHVIGPCNSVYASSGTGWVIDYNSDIHSYYATPDKLFTPSVTSKIPYAILCYESDPVQQKGYYTFYFDYVQKNLYSGQWYGDGDILVVYAGDAVASRFWEEYSYYRYGSYCKVADDCNRVIIKEAFKNVKLESFDEFFKDFSKVETFTGLENLNTSEATTMREMFSGCYLVRSLDVSHFDTRKVTDMSHMFANCKTYLTSLDLSNFKTGNVKTMTGMFYNCYYMTSLDISGFDTQNVEYMNNMFYNCYYLTSLDVSSFDTRNVTDMMRMFNNCASLTTLDVSNFDTRNVRDMRYMFDSCYKLVKLDLSGFDTQKVNQMDYIFSQCKRLTTIYCDHQWVASLYRNDWLFSENDALVGAISFNSNYKTIDYANPTTGYFTKKPKFTFTVPASGVGVFSADVRVKVPEGLTAYYCMAPTVQGSSLTAKANQVNGQVIDANTGVLLRGEPGTQHTLSMSLSLPAGKDGNKLAAATTPTTISQSSGQNTNFYLNGGHFEKVPSATMSMPANSAYLPVQTSLLNGMSSPIVYLVYMEGGVATGLDNPSFTVHPSQPETDAIYNLNGQKLSKARRGINIINGKKVIVR